MQNKTSYFQSAYTSGTNCDKLKSSIKILATLTKLQARRQQDQQIEFSVWEVARKCRTRMGFSGLLPTDCSISQLKTQLILVIIALINALSFSKKRTS